MDIWISLLLFFTNIFDDALAVLFVRRAAQGKAGQVAIISGTLTFLIAFSVTKYMEDTRYLIPIILGSMLGSYGAVKFDRFNRRKKAQKTIEEQRGEQRSRT